MGNGLQYEEEEIAERRCEALRGVAGITGNLPCTL
jgi:hypothetical protein